MGTTWKPAMRSVRTRRVVGVNPKSQIPNPKSFDFCLLLISPYCHQRNALNSIKSRTIFGSAQDFLEDIPIAGSGSKPTFFIEFSHDSSLSATNY
jgi:hypothetical protein